MKKLKRGLILLVAVAMIFSMIPSTSFAWADTENPVDADDDSSSVFDVSEENETEENAGDVEEIVEETAQEPASGDTSGGTVPDEGKSTTPDGNIRLDVNFKAGATLVDNQYWVKTVENGNNHQQFQYHIAIDVNKEYYTQYKEGSIHITIPYSILKHMEMLSTNGVQYGEVDPSRRSLDTASNSCYLLGSVVPQDQVTSDSDWYYKQITKDGKKYYEIINCKPVAQMAANTFQFDVIYQTQYTTYRYADFNKNNLEACDSEPFEVHLEATNLSGETQTTDEVGPKVYMNTAAVLTELKKEFSTQWEKTVVNEEGDDVTHLYILYKISATVKGNGTDYPTQQYQLDFDDAFDGAFTNWLADSTDNNVNDSQTEFELYGYSRWYYTDETKFSKDDHLYLSHWEPEKHAYWYVLIRVEKPDSLYINYKLTNTIKANLHPVCGADPDGYKTATATWSMYYKNTSPTGRFMIHKWGNNNYDAPRHSRTDAYGVFTPYQVDWGHQNNELDLFNSGKVSELRGFRYFIWYEGYSVKHTPYTEPHELTYSFEDQDIGVLGRHANGQYNTLNDETNFKAGWLTSNTYNGTTKTALDPADYYFSEVDFYPEAQNATYSEEKEKWVITREGDPFEGDEPIIIQAKFGSKSAEWTDVAKVKYNKDYSASKEDATGEIVWSDSSLADVSFGAYEGEKYAQKDYGFIIKFNDKNCVAYRIVHTNTHYYFMCDVKPTVNLKNSSFVKGVLSGRTWTYVENSADMNVYDKTSTEESDHRIFNFERDAEEGGHLPNRIAADAAVTQNNLLNVNKYNTDGEPVHAEQLYRTSWLINARGYQYAGVCPVGVTYPIADEIFESGTFFDILPRGTDFDADSLKVYNIKLPKSYYNKTQEDKSQYDPELDAKYLLIPGTDYTYELITGTYNGHSLNGLTMLKITITAKGTEDDLSDIYDVYSGYTAVFDTVSYYEDLKQYGNTLLNAIAFRGGNETTYHEWGFPDDPLAKDKHGNYSALTNIGDHPDKDNAIAALKDLEPKTNPYWFGYNFDKVTVYYNQYFVSGLSKRVKAEGDTTWGIRKEVKPSGKYYYRIRYATDDKTTVSDLILYDKIEGYVDPERQIASEWYGTLNSMVIVPPRGVTNVPVKYYVSDKDEAVVGNAIDLTDGSTWTEVPAGADLSNMTVKWVAADMTGFTLDKNSVINLDLTMTAPAENPTNKIKPVTYNDSHDEGIQTVENPSRDATPVGNVSNQTEVRYVLGGEVWIEKVDEEGNPIPNVTFTLEGTSSLLDDDGNPAEVEMTAKTDREGHAIFKDVPLSGTGSYTLSETVPAGYWDEGKTWTVEILEDASTQIDGEDKTGVYLVVVNKAGAEISVEKKWKNANGSTTAPRGATVTLTLYADGEPTAETVVLDGTADQKQPDKAGYEYEKWKAKFTGLKKYRTGTTTEIEYSVVETAGWPGFTADPAEAVLDGGVITNIQDTIDLWADKSWLNLDGTDDPPEGAKITFNLLRKSSASTGWMGVTGYAVELDGVVDEEPEVYGGWESEPWKASFKNLPKYQAYNGEALEYEYRIYESVTWDIYDPSAMVESGGTITNKPAATFAWASKKWVRADGTTEVPEGATVTLTLYADGEPTDFSVTLDGNTDAVIDVTGGYESMPWRARFVQLPYYRMQDGKRVKIEYTIVETAGWPGFEPSTEPVVSSGTITNTEIPTEVTAEKQWQGIAGNNTPPEGAKITFTLVVDGVESTTKKVELDGTVDTAANNNGYEYEEWKAKFPNLPKYKAVNGEAVEIEYTVKETITWPGYTPSTDEAVANGGIIINIETPIELSVVKAWKNADGTTTPPEDAEVTFTLYANDDPSYAVTLDGEADAAVTQGGYESEAWKATFTGLPQYKIVDGKQVKIEYTVKETETGKWPGYTVSYPNANVTYATDGQTITNSQEVTTLKVTKAWKNADGTTTAPDGGKVTFTLCADGEETDLTLELDGETDMVLPIPGRTSAIETESWVATFFNVPKYKIENGTAVEIEYTVKETETGKWPGYTVTYAGGATATSAAAGETITNSQEVTTLKVTKAWKNADGTTTAPDGGKVTFTLCADGEETDLTLELDGETDMVLPIPGRTSAIETESWVATFFNVPKYKIENGTAVEIEYTVKETETGKWPGYTVTYAGGATATSAAAGETITNEQITTEVSGIKTWNDSDFYVDGVPVNGYQRPESITINLLADGVVIDTKVVTEQEGWEYEFTDLPKYRIENGTAIEIVYTVEEEVVPGYETVIEGTDVENTPVKAENVKPIDLLIRKVDALTYNDNIDVGDVTLDDTVRSESGSTDIVGLEGAEFTLTYPDGHEKPFTTDGNGECLIKFEEEGTYKLQETKAPNGYQNPGTEYTIEVTKVLVNVALVDDETAPGGKKWVWYYELEMNIEGADFSQDLGTLTVQDPPELINIEGQKIWDDKNNAAGFRPTSITVMLYADGEKIDEKVVTAADNWKFTFSDLPKMKDGKEIVYTIDEAPVEYYEKTIKKYTITNKYIKTGDEMNLGLWIGILVMAIAAIGIVAVSRLIKKR